MTMELSTARRQMHELAADERPRERLARHGAQALSNRELIALLLGSGARRRPVLELAEDLVAAGLRGLAAASLEELERQQGLGRAKATRLLAALELGARLASESNGSSARFLAPADAARYLMPRYASRPVETFGVLALDVRHRLKKESVVSLGGLSASVVHPREVFAVPLSIRAAALILFHNHPSGDPEPSGEDIALTRRLAAAGALLGVEVIDHLVLGAGRFVSLKDRGAL